MFLLFMERKHMPGRPQADEAGGHYHSLNRGNLRANGFRKDADFAAFERILHAGIQIYRSRRWNWTQFAPRPLSSKAR